MSMARITFAERKSTVCASTGEVMNEESTTIVKLPTEPPFVKLYLDDLGNLLDIPASQKKLMMLLIKKIDFEGIITLSQRSRKIIAEKLEIRPQTLSNYIQGLVKKGLIKTLAPNEWQANPNYFARGNWREVYEQRRAFELRVRYHGSKRLVSTHAVEDEGDTHLQ